MKIPFVRNSLPINLIVLRVEFKTIWTTTHIKRMLWTNASHKILGLWDDWEGNPIQRSPHGQDYFTEQLIRASKKLSATVSIPSQFHV